MVSPLTRPLHPMHPLSLEQHDSLHNYTKKKGFPNNPPKEKGLTPNINILCRYAPLVGCPLS